MRVNCNGKWVMPQNNKAMHRVIEAFHTLGPPELYELSEQIYIHLDRNFLENGQLTRADVASSLTEAIGSLATQADPREGQRRSLTNS